MMTMSVPNEFLGSNHSFHPDNVPLVIQAAHSNSNFAASPATNNVAQFCGTNFFPNTFGYDVSMLPFLHHTTQRAAHFNSPFVQQSKVAQPEVSSKDEVPQLTASVNCTTTSFNNDVTAQSAYWSRQSQLGSFGVPSHEISSNQVEEKSPYENVLNAHYIAQSLNNLNQLPMTDGDKKANQQKNKESVKKQPQSYVPQKSMNDMKMFQMHDEMGYRNGVINHGQIATKLDQNKLINYKKMSNEVPASETPVMAARDYRTFKSEASLFHTAAPVVKYTGKASKQFAQKVAVKTNPASAAVPLMKNQRGVSCSPLMAAKMADFHREDSRSSPLSDDNMGEQMRYSSPNNIKEQEAVYHNLNNMNNICHPSGVLGAPLISAYRDQHQDMTCHMNGNKNKVTAQFSKLPTNSSPNSAIVADTSQMSRKAPFTPPYLFNEQLNQQKRPEKPSERVETHVQVAANAAKMAMHGDVNSMLMSKQSSNGSVGYSSVIMRTDRNYETDEKMEKSARQQRQQPVLWQNNNESVKADKANSYKNELTAQGQRNLLLGLTERQQLYFDNSPCQPHITQNMANLKCNSTKNAMKSMYDPGQHVMEAQQMPAEQKLHQYQQYMPPVKLPTTPMNQPILESADEKSFSRKRRSPKTPEYAQNRDPPPAHVNLYQQQMQSNPYAMENAAVNRYEVPNQYYSQNSMQSYTNLAAVSEQPHHQTPSMTSRMSNCGSPMRQMSQVAPTHTLSTYFASAQPNQYAESEYQVPAGSAYADPMQHYASNDVPSYVPNMMTSNCEPQVDESRSKVIVPDVEDEFKFLFDPTLHRYKEIARPAEEEALYRNKSAIFYRNKIDFLTSYMKFLENNCESVETLSDANSATVKTWNRYKAVYQPSASSECNKDELKPKPVPAPLPKEPVKPVPKEPVKLPPVAVTTKEPECNFENDPRYYPLPKSSDKRRLDSSSEDEFDDSSKKAKTSDNDGVRKSSGEKPKKKVSFKKDIKTVKIIESSKKKVPKKDAERDAKKSSKVQKTKPEKVEKVKRKMEKPTKNGSVEKIKPKVEKAMAEVKVAKPTVVPPKKRSSKDSSEILFLPFHVFTFPCVIFIYLQIKSCRLRYLVEKFRIERRKMKLRVGSKVPWTLTMSCNRVVIRIRLGLLRMM